MALKGIQYSGDIFLRRYNADGTLPETLIGPIEGTKLSIKTDADIKYRKSKQRGTHGQVKGSTSVNKPTQFGIGVNAADPEMLALLFMGTASVLSIASGTVSAESHALPHGTWVKLSHRNVSSVAITGKVLGTDFEVNSRLGLIRSLATGTIVDGASTSIAYSHGAITGKRIAGGDVSKIEVELTFDGLNLEDNSDCYGLVPKLVLMPKTDINLLADDFVTAEFDGTAIKLYGQAEHTFDTDVGYA
ncbi:MAG: hypothetical protein WAW36_18910 [Methylovulum miyakonense]|uniref:phage tail tube protein n=1 Tax=Methylovulum miyakonense TaxID=645578 RepID=UPI003BB72159